MPFGRPSPEMRMAPIPDADGTPTAEENGATINLLLAELRRVGLLRTS